MFFKSYIPERDDRNVIMELNICTGEKTIGFKNPATGKTENAVIVRTQNDIESFYREYKLMNTKKFKV
ncbi:MAG: hypothetical protein LUD03_06045 [Firmicutes bacterium]|nr:hypothetical protein [Bacillota bacterium]